MSALSGSGVSPLTAGGLV